MPEEILDIYDEKGSRIGTAPRSEVHLKGYWHKTAQVWLINEKSELLLQLRSDNKDCFPSLWDISSAGHIPAGCPVLESAVRELEEELGLSHSEGDLKFLFELAEPFVDPNIGHIDREFAQVYLLQVEGEPEFKLQVEEVAAIRWIHYKDLLEDFNTKSNEYVPHKVHFEKLVGCLQKLGY